MTSLKILMVALPVNEKFIGSWAVGFIWFA